jgi:hypothetical protein
MRDDRVLVERLDAKAEVIHVAALPRVGFHKIDHGVAHPQVGHAELGTVGNMGGAEDIAIEAAHRIDVLHAQDNVVDTADLDHRPKIVPQRRAHGACFA